MYRTVLLVPDGLLPGNAFGRVRPPSVGGTGDHGEMPVIALRPVADADLDALFEQMRDPESVRMAAFTPADPDDRAAFDAHVARVLSTPGITHRSITCDGRLVGSIAAFVIEGQTEVTYWIDRAAWGRGVASRALELLLEEVPARPVYARAASDNAASLRVLEKSGFQVIGTENSFAPGRKASVEETILRKE
jgi:RimJ/RimL family protein N-acetyltransferase